jgi:hypothetical protein
MEHEAQQGPGIAGPPPARDARVAVLGRGVMPILREAQHQWPSVEAATLAAAIVFAGGRSYGDAV